MAAPAVARVHNHRRGEWTKFWAGIAVTVALNLIGLVYSYGQLSQRVNDLHESVQELRQDVRSLKGK